MSFERQVKASRSKIDSLDSCAVYGYGAMVDSMVKYHGAGSERLGLYFLTTLALRFAVTDRVGQIKIDHGVPSVIQPEREQQVYSRVVAENESFGSSVSVEDILKMWHAIHDESVKRQEAQKQQYVAKRSVA